MTTAFSRLLAFPFALALILILTAGGLDFTGIRTILVLISIICLTLIYVFSEQINAWWWKKKMPPLDRVLRSWIAQHSPFYNMLSQKAKSTFERRISTFNLIKNFTLKVERDYQLEEDVKTIISHEFNRVVIHREDFLYEGFDHIVVYNHPFGSPDVQTLHTLELNREDKVIILSKEQLINGFIDPQTYVNVSLLAAVMAFVAIHPRLSYPEVSQLNLMDIAEAHGIELKAVTQALGVDWINRLDLLIFCYFQFPNRTESFDPARYEQLEQIFGNI